MKYIAIALLVIVLFPVIVVGGFVFNWFGKAVSVASEQVDPRELLRKYMYFKDLATSLDQQRANIDTYTTNITDITTAYKETPRQNWPRDERERLDITKKELSGLKMNYNRLAAEYNAAMSKINWRFCNVGDLPKGANEVLPREFRIYINN